MKGTGDLDLVVVGGAGHAGLPISLAFAESGLRVGIYDRSETAVAALAAGSMPFLERGGQALLAKALAAGRIEVSTSPSTVGRATCVLVVISTPIDEFLKPSLTPFVEMVDEIAPFLRIGSLLVLRSTVFPGTTSYVRELLSARGLEVSVAFCPERIAEGRAIEELSALPEIVGADDELSSDRAEALFQRLAPKTIRTTTREAELAKLFTNSWRYVKFAIANQFFLIAHQAGADYGRILRAVRDDYPRAADLPGPGFAAGPCLLKDTMQLAAFASDHFPIGHSAMQINEGLPGYIVDVLQRERGLAGVPVGILGMAFKAGSDDPRASLSYRLRRLLLWRGARVLATDPFVRDPDLVSLERVLAESEIVIVATPHDEYRAIETGAMRVVDVWGVMGRGIVL